MLVDMRTAILCPGPSLLESFSDEMQYDARIGVNRAVNVFRCDYWASLDERTFEIAEPIGHPIWLCDKAMYQATCDKHEPARAFPHHAVEDIRTPRDPLCWHWYTFPASLVWAYEIGATSIDVYGCDWTDAPDFDGGSFPSHHRTARRWEREAGVVCGIVEWLAGKGVPVYRQSVNGVVPWR